MNRVVIVGAGYAGILTAKKLARKFRGDAETSITLIDKNPFHTMLTELHEVAAGRVEEDSIKISIKKVIAGRNIQFIQDFVESINFDQKTVLGKNGSYGYDYLVMAAGSRPNYFGIPGAEEHTCSLWSYNDAIKLKEHILNRFRQAAVETDEQERRRLLTFHVVGAGLTGVEMAGELAEYAPVLCERFELDKKELSLVNVDLLPRVVPSLPEKLSAKIQRRLEKMGVNVLLNTKVAEIGADYIDLNLEGKISRQITGTVIWVGGIKCAYVAAKAGENVPCDSRGRLSTDKYLRCEADQNFYVVGDNLNFIPEGETQPVLQMVENCEQSSGIAAHNIYVSITGRGELKEYKPKFHGVMVSVGGRYAVARVGWPGLMVNLPSFLAMFIKHFINILYFAQILGWNKIFSYLKHEFFTIRNRRSFVGGHLSNRTPSFLLVPLRLWLGAVWIFEGIMKIMDGWFDSPKLLSFFGGANAWFDSLLSNVSEGPGSGMKAAASVSDTVTSATVAASPAADVVSAATGVRVASSVADAATSATGAASHVMSSMGTVIMNWDIFGLFKMIFVSGKTLAESTIADYAFKLDIPIMNWFINTFIMPYDWVQVGMQIFIVSSEVLIGLALIGGLFTTLLGALSLVLLFMFVTTTGLYLSSFWMFFAGIIMLWGAGSIFGLDYYTSPLLKKSWRRLGWVRRLYIYHD
ncbi:MAG: NAD(P)/FAD-dependent oxidoreductase [Firmicutes bacterium]|nr:NAD(P)/FAD-dependent oxidoreductase [Bacillota bacterium]